MKNILLLNNDEKITQTITTVLEDLIELNNYPLDAKSPKTQIDYFNFGLVIINVSCSTYRNALLIAKKLRKISYTRFIFLAENLEEKEKKKLLDFYPVYCFDVSTIENDVTYNIKSFIFNFLCVDQYSISKKIIDFYFTSELFKNLNQLNINKIGDEKVSENKNNDENLSHTIKALSKLSNRERELYHLLIKGVSVKNIVDIMNIQQSTISTLKSRVFYKLGVNNVVELTHLAYAVNISSDTH